MARRAGFTTMALMTSLITINPGAIAQQIVGARVPSDKISTHVPTSSIRTDRLTPKQLRTWKEIELIVRAVDNSGRPLHPRLHSLWQRVQWSRHTIYITMKEPRCFSNIAGITTMQKSSSDGDREVIVIWLNLWAIDCALIDASVRRSDGLIPFSALGKYERYAEAFGHGLQHAVLMLEDPEYARLCLEYSSMAVNLSILSQQRSEAADNQKTKQRLRDLQSLGDKIERPAEAAKLEIWRELLSGQKREALVYTGSATGRTARATATGILTDRLSSRQLQTWKAIQGVVFAQDRTGRPLHPTLLSLWQRIEASGHTIHIEMPEPRSTHTSGNFSLEETASADRHQEGVIRLYLQVIDCASTSGQARPDNGFLPFERLRKRTLRYAEVLGHELAHALLTLTNPDYSRLVDEQAKETREFELYRRSHNGQPLDGEMRERLNRIQSISDQIERSAEEVEESVWRELSAGQRRRAREN